MPLAERLDDFYLPSIALEGINFEEASRWLIEQLRTHNYAKCADLEQLAMTVPGSAGKRHITDSNGFVTTTTSSSFAIAAPPEPASTSLVLLPVSW